MMNSILKVLGIVVLLLMALLLSGVLEIKENRTLDSVKVEYYENKANPNEANAAIDSKVYLITHYRIAMR